MLLIICLSIKLNELISIFNLIDCEVLTFILLKLNCRNCPRWVKKHLINFVFKGNE